MTMNAIVARFVVRTMVGLGLILSPVVASAQLPLPFATTYNCATQDQSTPGWVNCDGITKLGDWTTLNGSKEQITPAANYPGGAGGAGQRHWIGDSTATNNTSNSGGVHYGFPPVQEIYVRWYTRWEAGLKLGFDNPVVHRDEKLIYFNGTSCGLTYGCMFNVSGDRFRFIINTDYTGGGGWDQLFGGRYNAPSDGRWIMLEIHMKNSTGGKANGVVEMWADNVKVLDHHNVDFKGSKGFSGFAFPSNHGFTTVRGACCDMYQDLDDVAIRTTGPIGPIGSNNAPTTAPSAPNNLRITQ